MISTIGRMFEDVPVGFRRHNNCVNDLKLSFVMRMMGTHGHGDKRLYNRRRLSLGNSSKYKEGSS